MSAKHEIIIYQSADGLVKIDVRMEGETLWLTQAQMAELFGRDKSVINRHINNILKESELDEKVVVANFAITTQHGAKAPGMVRGGMLPFQPRIFNIVYLDRKAKCFLAAMKVNQVFFPQSPVPDPHSRQ